MFNHIFAEKNCVYLFLKIFFYLFLIDEGTAEVILMKGEPVIVIGNSPRRGHLVVEKQNHTIHIPFQYLELKRNF